MDADLVGLLLAAGRGIRYDPSGHQLKLLAAARCGPRAGAPLAVAAAAALASVLPRVTAVVRPADSDSQRRLHRLLIDAGCRLAICDDADDGISASIACGVRAEPEATGWVLALADMPAIQPSTVSAVASAMRAGAQTVAAVYRGTRGHPVGFAAGLRDELLRLEGDTGARSVLAAHAPLRVEVDDPGVLYDVDIMEERQ